MDKHTIDLLVAFAKLKGSIQLQIPPITTCSLFVEKFNRDTETFAENFPFTFE